MRRPHPGDCHAYRRVLRSLAARRPRRRWPCRAPTRAGPTATTKPPAELNVVHVAPSQHAAVQRRRQLLRQARRGSRGPDLLPGRERRTGRGVPPPPRGRALAARPCPTAPRSPRATRCSSTCAWWIRPRCCSSSQPSRARRFSPGGAGPAQDPLRPRRRRPQRRRRRGRRGRRHREHARHLAAGDARATRSCGSASVLTVETTRPRPT